MPQQAHIVDRIGARDHASDQRGQLLASRPYRSAHSTAAAPASRPRRLGQPQHRNNPAADARFGSTNFIAMV
jgi:hypothetical protein